MILCERCRAEIRTDGRVLPLGLTERQADVLRAWWAFEDRGETPSLRDLAATVGTTASSCLLMLQIIERKGVVINRARRSS